MRFAKGKEGLEKGSVRFVFVEFGKKKRDKFKDCILKLEKWSHFMSKTN